MNGEYLTALYNYSEPKLWKGFLLLPVDERKAKIPNSIENRKHCRKNNNRYSDIKQMQANARSMYDILNQFYLDIEILHISTSEIELAKNNLEHLQHININQPI